MLKLGFDASFLYSCQKYKIAVCFENVVRRLYIFVCQMVSIDVINLNFMGDIKLYSSGN